MSSTAGENRSGDSIHSEEPAGEQIVQDEVTQMGLASLSRNSSQEPVIEFSIINNSGSEEEDDEEDDVRDYYDQYGFFTNVVASNADDEQWSVSDDTWSDCSSSSDETNWFEKYGGWYFDIPSWRWKPLYQRVKPKPRRSCNRAAAALKEPLSLLTKYSHQRLTNQSEYFQESTPSPSEELRQVKQVRRGSLLKKVRHVDDQTLRWA